MKVKSNILIVFYSFPLQIITQLYIYLGKINVFYLYPQSINMNKSLASKREGWAGVGGYLFSLTSHSQMLKGVVRIPSFYCLVFSPN